MPANQLWIAQAERGGAGWEALHRFVAETPAIEFPLRGRTSSISAFGPARRWGRWNAGCGPGGWRAGAWPTARPASASSGNWPPPAHPAKPGRHGHRPRFLPPPHRAPGAVYLARHRRGILLAVLCTLLLAGLTALYPIVIQQGFDRFSAGDAAIAWLIRR